MITQYLDSILYNGHKGSLLIRKLIFLALYKLVYTHVLLRHLDKGGLNNFPLVQK
jgi:hypothetical protein